MKELIFKVTLGEYDYENTNYEQVYNFIIIDTLNLTKHLMKN